MKTDDGQTLDLFGKPERSSSRVVAVEPVEYDAPDMRVEAEPKVWTVTEVNRCDVAERRPPAPDRP